MTGVVRGWVLIACVLACVPQLARAQDAARVHVRIAADAAEREALERVLLELMQRLSVQLVAEPLDDAQLARGVRLLAADDREAYLARCVIDLRAQDAAVLYLHDPARDRILERRIARAAGDSEVVREALGHMLLAAIEALLAGATLGAPRAEVLATAPPEPAATPPPAPVEAEPAEPESSSSATPWSLRMGLAYEVEVLGHPPGLTHGPQLLLALRSPLPLGLGIMLSAQYRFGYEVNEQPIGLRAQSFPLRVLLTLERALGRRVSLRFGLGAGADVVRLMPSMSSDASVAPTGERTLAFAVARALVSFDAQVSRSLALFAALAADADFERTRYVRQERDGGEAPIATPWRLRPALLLGAMLP